MIPLIAVVGFETPYWHLPRIWIPLILLWIPLLLLSPLLLLVLAVASIATGIGFWKSIAVFWGILCSLPGTDVRVTVDHKNVVVRIL